MIYHYPWFWMVSKMKFQIWFTALNLLAHILSPFFLKKLLRVRENIFVRNNCYCLCNKLVYFGRYISMHACKEKRVQNSKVIILPARRKSNQQFITVNNLNLYLILLYAITLSYQNMFLLFCSPKKPLGLCVKRHYHFHSTTKTVSRVHTLWPS